MRRAIAGVALCLLTACAGSKRKPKPPPKPRPICQIQTSHAIISAREDRTLPHSFWLALLVSGYRESTGMITQPPEDCRGLPIKWTPPECANEPEPTRAPVRPISSEDVIVEVISPTERLIWAITDRLTDGQAQGPVALVELEKNFAAVRSMGVLRAYPGHARVDLQKSGSGRILVAEGQACDATGKACSRGLRLMTQQGDRFAPAPLSAHDGACLGSAWFPLTREETLTARGERRLYRLNGTVNVDPDAIKVHEQVEVFTLPAGDAEGAVPMLLRKEQEDWVVRVIGSRLVTTASSLWTRMVATP